MSKDVFCGLLLIIGIIFAVAVELYRTRKPQGILKKPMYRDKYEYLVYLENEMHYWQGEYNAASDDEQISYTFNQMMYYQGQAEQVASEIENGDMTIH